MSQRSVDVGAQPVSDLAGDVGTAGVTLIVGGLQDTILVQVTQRHHVLSVLATAGHLQLVLVTEGVLADYAVIPVLVPGTLGILANITGSRINDLVPSVVFEGVVLLTTQLATQAGTSIILGIAPAVAVVDSLVAQGFVNELNILLLVHMLVALGST